ncbi:hypothetical protein TNCV_4908821 [Trichonephila clavipes]|uniref:Uncharacterized protein n=1 Tax=Trichonephila clavipes TaxID=2585209 RepID=A0A8X6RSZ0_TRICX|nr:hypothetical protein TNCV_4908821 [Trichonephila clavipes]
MREKVCIVGPSVLSVEFVAVDDDNGCTAPIIADKKIVEFDESSKNSIDADSDDKNEMNNAAPVPTSSEMSITVKIHDNNVGTAPITVDKDILKFVQIPEKIIDAYPDDDENEINNAASVPTSSEMRNVMKCMHDYLVRHSNGEIN